MLSRLGSMMGWLVSIGLQQQENCAGRGQTKGKDVDWQEN